VKFEECQQGKKAEISFLKKLPFSQAGVGRHKCVICAYIIGVKDGSLLVKHDSSSLEVCQHGSIAPIEILDSIHDNQSQGGRHKCTVCAYYAGYMVGVENIKIQIKNNSVNIGKLNNKNEEIKPKETKIKNFKNFMQKRNYLVEQMHKIELGLIGELYVAKYEKDNGCIVEHVSIRDDSMGYDIKSVKNKQIKYIEVKTTTSGLESSFFMSKNELDFMRQNESTYKIYRVYNLNYSKQQADLKILSASDLDSNFDYECQSFAITIKGLIL
jgi:hypothetical protein